MDHAGLAGNLITASTAIAGLILVFLGIVLTAFDGYETTEQNAVRGKFQQRAVIALVGFLLSVFSCVFGIAALWPSLNALVWPSLIFFIVSVVFVVLAALACVRDLFKR